MDTDPDPPQGAPWPPLPRSREEKIKLVATTSNNAAGSCSTVGVIGPVVAVLINLSGARDKVELLLLVLNVGFWLSAAWLLHHLRETTARGSRQMTPEVIFVTMVLPIIVVMWGWLIGKLHERDLKRTYGR